MKNPSSEASEGSLAHPVPFNSVQAVTEWPWAQQRANFVLVAPRERSRWVLREPTLRGESPTHHSTLRAFVEDGDGRRLRVKQYLNDWWIPTIADISFRTPGRPVVYEREDVSFIGRDYRRHDASCGHRFGTNVEFSVESGTMADDDWRDVWQGLQAVVPAAVGQARASTTAQRNYWNRWGRTHAPWDTSEISSLRWTPPTSEAMEAAAWAITPDRWSAIPGAIDSLGTRDGPFGPEVQAVFRWPMSLNVSAWLRVLRAPPEPWKPLIDSSEVNRPAWEEVDLAGTRVRRAAMHPDVGNWMYAWRHEGAAYEMHLRAQAGFTASRADAVVQALLA